MKRTPVCPFFGKNDDYCDIGCGYISSSDVRMIISYCRHNFRDCIKYRELLDRHGEKTPAAALPETAEAEVDNVVPRAVNGPGYGGFRYPSPAAHTADEFDEPPVRGPRNLLLDPGMCRAPGAGFNSPPAGSETLLARAARRSRRMVRLLAGR